MPRRKPTARPDGGGPKKRPPQPPNPPLAPGTFDPRRLFLEAFSRVGTIRAACEAVYLATGHPLHRQRISEWRKADKTFAESFEFALEDSTDVLVETAIRLATQAWGAAPPNPQLLMFLIKKRDPSYRESHKPEPIDPNGPDSGLGNDPVAANQALLESIRKLSKESPHLRARLREVLDEGERDATGTHPGQVNHEPEPESDHQ